jgi:hypothetical protein
LNRILTSKASRREPRGWLSFFFKFKRDFELGMRKLYLATIFTLFSPSLLADDAIDFLGDLENESEEFREISIECLVEIKVSKENGWDSAECGSYKALSKDEFSEFKSNVKKATSDFKRYAESNEASNRRIKRGLKYLLEIQSDMVGLAELNNQIKNSSKHTSVTK